MLHNTKYLVIKIPHQNIIIIKSQQLRDENKTLIKKIISQTYNLQVREQDLKI